jgi:hypothetical protein
VEQVKRRGMNQVQVVKSSWVQVGVVGFVDNQVLVYISNPGGLSPLLGPSLQPEVLAVTEVTGAEQITSLMTLMIYKLQ